MPVTVRVGEHKTPKALSFAEGFFFFLNFNSLEMQSDGCLR